MSFDHRRIICLVELTIPIICALSDANKQPSYLANKQRGAGTYTISSAITQHVLDGQMEGMSILQQTGLSF